MLSKILAATRLSGQLWIKDESSRSRICVLELGALSKSSVGLLLARVKSGNRLSILASISAAKPHILRGFNPDFEGHSEASDVFARTVQGYPSSGRMSSGNRGFLRFPATFDWFGAASRGCPEATLFATAQRWQITERPTTGRGALSS